MMATYEELKSSADVVRICARPGQTIQVSAPRLLCDTGIPRTDDFAGSAATWMIPGGEIVVTAIGAKHGSSRK